MKSVGLKRAGVIVAVVCLVLGFVLYWNLRTVTIEESKRKEETARKEPPRKPLRPGKLSWTLDEAMDAYARQRDNAYLQYVMLQLAHNEKRTPDVLERFPELNPGRGREAHRVDLFDLFSGYHSIQESLQLEVMLAGQKGEPDVTSAGKATPLPKLAGPAVKSHPWKTMVAGRKPNVSELSRCVPVDFYLIEFRTLTKLLDTVASAQDWMTYYRSQANLDGTSPPTRQRLRTQLLLDDGPAQRPFFDAIVHNVALAGSDPFVNEGSDVTMLFQFQSPDFFQSGIQQIQELVRKQHPHVREQKGQHLGVEYTALTTADRAVHLYYADPKTNLHIRSNSLVGLKRVLETTLGRASSLGDSAEFRYIRTLMPLGAAEEDGLIYLSDAFVRRLIGPATKITEARRLIGYNHLRMISHAAQMYRTQFGKAPKTLAELEQANCAPGKFNAGKLKCPFGGSYTLSEDGAFGVSSILGTAQFLTPCCELPTPDASAAEAEAYAQFLNDYERYWRTYFDPIAIRLQAAAKRIRVETLVLPLIDNSIYAFLGQVVGKQPEPLDHLPVPSRNLFSLNLCVNREALVQAISTSARLHRAKLARAVQGVTAPTTPAYPSNLPNLLWEDMKNVEALPSPLEDLDLNKFGLAQEKLDAFLERGIGNQVGLHFYDTQIMFDINLTQFIGSVFQMAARTPIAQTEDTAKGARLWGLVEAEGLAYAASSLIAPIYVAVPIKDATLVDNFLAHLDSVVVKASNLRSDDRLGVLRVSTDFYHLQNRPGLKVRAFGIRYGPLRYRIFWTRIGDGLYLTNQPYVLDDLHAAHARWLKTGSSPPGPAGHALMRIRPEHWNKALEGYKLGWAENNREACQRNQSMLSAAARAFSASPPVSMLARDDKDRERLIFDYAKKMYGVDFACPDGGEYVLEADGKTCRCTVHGTLDQPIQANAPAKNSPVGHLMRDFKDLHATLTILPEGLRAVVVMERK
jgi:hypothetical protein